MTVVPESPPWNKSYTRTRQRIEMLPFVVGSLAPRHQRNLSSESHLHNLLGKDLTPLPMAEVTARLI